jgi:RHS repeat-associated protein
MPRHSVSAPARLLPRPRAAAEGGEHGQGGGRAAQPRGWGPIFTGKEEDIEVGLTYFGARYYSANLGRFVSPDPLTIHGLGADLNPYAYVGGRVMTHVDPWGLQACPSDECMVIHASEGAQRHAAQVAHLESMGVDPRDGSPAYRSESLGLAVMERISKVTGAAKLLNAARRMRQKEDRKKVAKGFVRSRANRLGGIWRAGDGAFGPAAAGDPAEAAGAALEEQQAEAIVAVITAGASALPAAAGGAFSPIVEGGGLAAHEAAGGHLLARHVGLNAAALDARLAAQRNLTVASSFATRAEAEAAGSEILRQNAGAVSVWTQAGATGRLTVGGGFSGGTIRVLGGYSAEATGATFVLQGNGAGGFFILTGFPVP